MFALEGQLSTHFTVVLKSLYFSVLIEGAVMQLTKKNFRISNSGLKLRISKILDA